MRPDCVFERLGLAMAVVIAATTWAHAEPSSAASRRRLFRRRCIARLRGNDRGLRASGEAGAAQLHRGLTFAPQRAANLPGGAFIGGGAFTGAVYFGGLGAGFGAVYFGMAAFGPVVVYAPIGFDAAGIA